MTFNLEISKKIRLVTSKMKKAVSTREAIGNRVKELRKAHNFSQTYVSEQLCISQAAYSLIENSQNGIVADHIIKLSKLYDVTTDFILKGEKLLVRISRKNGYVPLIKPKAHAGYIDYLEKIRINHVPEEEYYDETDWYRIPGINPTINQNLFEVEGESMSPTILSGDVIICQDQPKLNNILDGSVLVVVLKEGIVCKRIRLDSDKDYLLLESDNDNMNEIQKVHKDEVRQALAVRGKISGVLVPHHQIASKGKIQAMEDSIELLKKELFKMSKKLESIRK